MMTRRSVAVVLAGAYVVCVAACGTDPADHTWSDAFAERFARADPSAGAMFRYWLPGGAVDEAQVVREI